MDDPIVLNIISYRIPMDNYMSVYFWIVATLQQIVFFQKKCVNKIALVLRIANAWNSEQTYQLQISGQI